MDLCYKILEIVERNNKFVRYKTNLLCVADCCNTTRCGFFFKEYDLYENEIDKRKLSVITEDQFIRVIDKIVKDVIERFL